MFAAYSKLQLQRLSEYTERNMKNTHGRDVIHAEIRNGYLPNSKLDRNPNIM
jgi:hypothetical protein